MSILLKEGVLSPLKETKIKHTEKDGLIKIMRSVIPKTVKTEDVVFVCIGTDRSTGDSLGPMIGSMLKSAGYESVYGTLDHPVHAMNLEDNLKYIQNKHEDKMIIAIDACLGKTTSVGNVIVSNRPLRPGAGVKKELPEVGDYHIAGIVNVGGFMEYLVLQNTRLHIVMGIAESIMYALTKRFPLKTKIKQSKEEKIKFSYLWRR